MPIPPISPHDCRDWPELGEIAVGYIPEEESAMGKVRTELEKQTQAMASYAAQQLAAEERARSEAAQKEASQFAEEHAKQKRDKVFDVFLVFLGSALTLLVEHFTAVADFIASLFS